MVLPLQDTPWSIVGVVGTPRHPIIATYVLGFVKQNTVLERNAPLATVILSAACNFHLL